MKPNVTQYGSVNLISRLILVRVGGLCIISGDYPTGTLRVGGACALRLQSLTNRTVLQHHQYRLIPVCQTIKYSEL